MTLSFDTIFRSFGINHCRSQQVSFATLLDADGNVVAGGEVLECDGHDHVCGIERKVDDWHLKQDRLNGTGDYAGLVVAEQERVG